MMGAVLFILMLLCLFVIAGLVVGCGLVSRMWMG
jgi:hypothetical protein